MNILEKLLKSKQELESDSKATEEETIEKSFDEALEEVQKATKVSKDGVKKADKMAFNEEDEDEDEGEEEDESDEEDMGKSEDDIFVDAEPIIKSLMSKIEKKIDRLDSRLATVEKISKAHAELSITEAALVKSMGVTSDKEDSEPEERKGLIKSQDRSFGDPSDNKKTLSKSEAQEKLQSLIKANKVTSVQVAVIEGRINKGLDLPEVMFAE